jgi:hypothetical protein
MPRGSKPSGVAFFPSPERDGCFRSHFIALSGERDHRIRSEMQVMRLIVVCAFDLHHLGEAPEEPLPFLVQRPAVQEQRVGVPDRADREGISERCREHLPPHTPFLLWHQHG